MTSRDGEDLTTLHPGRELHEYRIERILGQGGFGITYLARDSSIERWVALKEYFPSSLATRLADATVMPKGDEDTFAWGLRRFVDEARLLARFNHPAIVRVLRYFEMFGTAYMVMDYVPGPSLSQFLKERPGPLPFEVIRARVLPVLDGLEAVHAAGVVHRDITPGNIIVGTGGSPVLIDFGAARQLLAEHSRALTSLGTPGYAPIEQYCSTPAQQGPWTDVYAVAAVLYRCIAGQAPVDAHDRLKNDPLRPAVTVGAGRYPAAFLRAIDRGLAVDAEERPRDIRTLRQALDGADIRPGPGPGPGPGGGGLKLPWGLSRAATRRAAFAGLGVLGVAALALVQTGLLPVRPNNPDAVTCDRLAGPLDGAGARGGLVPTLSDDMVTAAVEACARAVSTGGDPSPHLRLQLARVELRAGQVAEAHRRISGLAGESYPPGQWALATEYFQGGEVPVDYAQALRWYRASAEQKYGPALLMLGTMALHGQGGAADPEQARRYLTEAAAQRQPEAMRLLGALATGQGDPVAAVRWYREAAGLGSGDAAKLLGESLYQGRGLARNPVLALAYLRIAATRLGAAVPSTILGRVEADLTPPQRAEAESLAASWRPGTPLPEETRSWTH